MTATDPLATAVELAALGYPDGLDEGLILRASARVRAYTGQTVSKVDDDVVQLPAADPLRLPQRPVISVSEVALLLDDDTAIVLPAASWRLRNNQIEGIGCNASWPYLGSIRYVKITYTHGYAAGEVPQSVVDVVGSITARLTDQQPGIETGKQREAIDDYQVTYADQMLDMAANLLPGEKDALDRALGAARAGTLQL